MSTDLKKRVPPKSNSSAGKTELAEVLESGIGDVSVRELLGMLISSVGVSERKAYLGRVTQDKANGFYDRNLQVGTIPVDIEVARTRSGRFRPAVLPAAYERGYSDETQSILLGLLASGRSVNAVKEALGKMGLSSAKQDLGCDRDQSDRRVGIAQQPAAGSRSGGSVRRWQVRRITRWR